MPPITTFLFMGFTPVSSHFLTTHTFPAGTGSPQAINQPSAGFQGDSKVSSHSGVRVGFPWEWNSWGADEAVQLLGPGIGSSLFLPVSWHRPRFVVQTPESCLLSFPEPRRPAPFGPHPALFRPWPWAPAGVSTSVWRSAPFKRCGDYISQRHRELPDAAPTPPTPLLAASPRGGAGLEGGGDLMSS